MICDILVNACEQMTYQYVQCFINCEFTAFTRYTNSLGFYNLYECDWPRRLGGVFFFIVLSSKCFVAVLSMCIFVRFQIWDQSDPNGKGYLDKNGFCVALKLIALAQARQEINVAHLTKDTPPPNLVRFYYILLHVL